MPIQEIVTIKSKSNKLEVPAKPVLAEEFGSAWLYEVVENLRDTMNA